MKHIYILLFVFSISHAFGQDIIFTNNGNKIEAKVKEISDAEISYLRFDNLEGPIFKEKISSIKEIIFENGTSISFSDKKNIDTLTLEETKAFIIQSINNFAYERDGDKAYRGSFEGNYLQLSRRNTQTNEIYDNYRLYDFSADCEFHDLSERGNGLSYINVYVPRIVNGKSNYGYKLVICVKEAEQGELLLEALKKYNQFFKED